MIQSEIDYTAADRGIRSSAEHAESDVAGWSELALWYVRQFAASKGVAWTMESCRTWAYIHGLPKPEEERAFGSVTQKAIRQGIIRKTGQYAPAASSNGSPKPLYVGCV